MHELHQFHMRATIERADEGDEDTRSVNVVISTEQPVDRGDGVRTVLPHTKDAVDLARAVHGLPMLTSHDYSELPVGRVENVTVDEDSRKLRGRARFSRNERGAAAWQDVRDGILTDVSVGAQVSSGAWVEDEESRTITATRWTPIEVSLVSVGADSHAGINRGQNMSEATTTATQRGNVTALFEGLEGEEWVRMERDALARGDSVPTVQTAIMERLKAMAADVPDRSAADTVTITPGTDQVERFVKGFDLVVRHRCDLVADDERASVERSLRESELAGMTMRELAREYLRATGLRAVGDAYQVIGQALTRPAVLRNAGYHSTSDFANVLTGNANASLAAGYAEAPETYGAWTRNMNLTDFKAHTFPNLSNFSDLDKVEPGAEFKRGTFSDRAESLTLGTYGKLFGVSRQALVNDSLSAMSDVPRKMGRAAARQVGDLAYQVLFDDTVLSDQAGATLFNTTDGTLAASATAITTAGLSAARQALRTRTDPSGARLNIMGRTLLVPAGKETEAATLLASEKDPSEGATTSFDAANIFRGAYSLVVEPRLDDDDVNAWYLMGVPGRECEGVSIGWLDGRQTPVLEQQDGWTVDGVEWKVRIDCTAGALDWRGLYKNDGA